MNGLGEMEGINFPCGDHGLLNYSRVMGTPLPNAVMIVSLLVLKIRQSLQQFCPAKLKGKTIDGRNV